MDQDIWSTARPADNYGDWDTIRTITKRTGPAQMHEHIIGDPLPAGTVVTFRTNGCGDVVALDATERFIGRIHLDGDEDDDERDYDRFSDTIFDLVN